MNNELFIDNDFNMQLPDEKDIIWKRPFEIVKDPMFIDYSVSLNDLSQGGLGNCWLIASLLVLIKDSFFFYLMINPLQSFNPRCYSGKFAFYLYKNNTRQRVEIDDRLPTLNNELIYCRNKVNKHEFWPALLEKAFAKIYGNSYKSLNVGGYLHESLSYFGIKNFNEYNSEILKARKININSNLYLFGSNSNILSQDPYDVVGSHVYSLVDYKKDETDYYIQLKNPYNDKSEYSKQFLFDQDSKIKDDGLFWIKFDQKFIELFPYFLEIHKSIDYVSTNISSYKNNIIWSNCITMEKTLILFSIVIRGEFKNKKISYMCCCDNHNRFLLFERNFEVNKENIFRVELDCSKLLSEKENKLKLIHYLYCSDGDVLENTFFNMKLY